MSHTFFAPAKINLWLRIFAPDKTGYHPLDTLFCALQLADEIVIDQDATDIELVVSGADVGVYGRNLAFRAADEFFRATGLPPAVSIHLTKHIPAAAGLGGGSSDAATVLLALNRLHGTVLPAPDLLALGARLGSDVPFFLCGSSLAHATGYGEQLRGLPALPRAPVVLVVPSFPIATVVAYRWLDEAAAYSGASGPDARLLAWSDVEQAALNQFEAVLYHHHPHLRVIKQALHERGAQIALVSGSGSTVFGIYASDDQAARAATEIQSEMPDTKVILTATRP